MHQQTQQPCQTQPDKPPARSAAGLEANSTNDGVVVRAPGSSSLRPASDETDNEWLAAVARATARRSQSLGSTELQPDHEADGTGGRAAVGQVQSGVRAARGVTWGEAPLEQAEQEASGDDDVRRQIQLESMLLREWVSTFGEPIPRSPTQRASRADWQRRLSCKQDALRAEMAALAPRDASSSELEWLQQRVDKCDHLLDALAVGAVHDDETTLTGLTGDESTVGEWNGSRKHIEPHRRNACSGDGWAAAVRMGPHDELVPLPHWRDDQSESSRHSLQWAKYRPPSGGLRLDGEAALPSAPTQPALEDRLTPSPTSPHEQPVSGAGSPSRAAVEDTSHAILATQWLDADAGVEPVVSKQLLTHRDGGSDAKLTGGGSGISGVAGHDDCTRRDDPLISAGQTPASDSHFTRTRQQQQQHHHQFPARGGEPTARVSPLGGAVHDGESSDALSTTRSHPGRPAHRTGVASNTEHSAKSEDERQAPTREGPRTTVSSSPSPAPPPLPLTEAVVSAAAASAAAAAAATLVAPMRVGAEGDGGLEAASAAGERGREAQVAAKYNTPLSGLLDRQLASGSRGVEGLLGIGERWDLVLRRMLQRAELLSSGRPVNFRVQLMDVHKARRSTGVRLGRATS